MKLWIKERQQLVEVRSPVVVTWEDFPDESTYEGAQELARLVRDAHLDRLNWAKRIEAWNAHWIDRNNWMKRNAFAILTVKLNRHKDTLRKVSSQIKKVKLASCELERTIEGVSYEDANAGSQESVG